MKKKANANNKKWFIKVRGSYLPNNSMGWLSYLPYLAYLIGVTAAAIHERYGFITTMLVLIPNWVVAAMAMSWLAANHS